MSEDHTKSEFMLAAVKKIARSAPRAFGIRSAEELIDDAACRCTSPQDLLDLLECLDGLCASLLELDEACDRLFRVVSRAASIAACGMMPTHQTISIAFLCYLRCAAPMMGAQRVHTAFVACMCVMRAPHSSRGQAIESRLLEAAGCTWGDVFDMMQATQNGHGLEDMDLATLCSASHAMRLLCSIPMDDEASDALVRIVINAQGANTLVEQLRNFRTRPYLNFLQALSGDTFHALCSALDQRNVARVARVNLPAGYRAMAEAMCERVATAPDTFEMAPPCGRIKYALPGHIPATARHFNVLSPGSTWKRSHLLIAADTIDTALFALENAQMPPEGAFLLECIQSPLWGSERGYAAMKATFDAAPLSALVDLSAAVVISSLPSAIMRACMDACVPLWTALDPTCVEDVILFATAMLVTLSCADDDDSPAWDPQPIMAAMGVTWSDVVGVLRLYMRCAIDQRINVCTLETHAALGRGVRLVHCVRDRLTHEDAADLLDYVRFSRLEAVDDVFGVAHDRASHPDSALRDALVNMVLDAGQPQLLLRKRFLRDSAFIGTCAMERLCSGLRPEDWSARGEECCVILTVTDTIVRDPEARATLRVAAAAAPVWVKRITYWNERNAAENLLHLAQANNYAESKWVAWGMPDLLEKLTPTTMTKSAAW